MNSRFPYSTLLLRRDEASAWTSKNPVLGSGEPGFEIDTNKLKIGNGIDDWNSLDYIAGGGGGAGGDLGNYFNTNLAAGSGISFVYDSGNSTLTINSSGVGVSSGDCCNPFDQDLNTFNSPTFNNITISGSKINGGGTNSGDGNGYGTIELIPDSGLYTNDQYLIVDPTGPNHIHLRAGGTQDNSNAEIIIGGEKNNVRVNDQSPLARLQTESLITLNTYYFTSPSPDFSSIVWETFEGNNRIVINDPTSIIYDAVWAFTSDSIFSVVDSDGNSHVLTRNGSSTPGGAAPVMVYVMEAPPTNPTNLTQLTFEIREVRQAYLEANGSDVRIQAADDVRIYSNDAFRLYNYSATDPIEIITDYDDQEHRWAFNSDGNLEIPGNILFSNGTSVATGTYNNGTNGNNGISLNCAVGYQLNWQGGHLKNTEIGDSTNTSRTIYVDSSLQFPGSGVANVQVSSSGIVFSDGTSQTTAYTGGGGGLSDSNTYIICKTGDDLIAKYTAAKNLTPGGNALSSTNRATLIIMPGNYSLSEELVIDAEFVDILGLGSMKLHRGCVTAVTLLNNTINVIANDVRVKGIGVGTQSFKIGNSLPLQIIEDCVGGNLSFGFYISGTFINCFGGDWSFGSSGSASGHFINCVGGIGSFAGYQGGGGGNASGTFINCTGGEYSFGSVSSGIAGGFFEHCVGGANSFGGDGGTLSGTLLQCRLTSGTFPTLSGSGKIRLCIDGNYDVINADVP